MEAKDKRRWVWMLATGAAVAGGAYLLYNAWKEAERRETDDADTEDATVVEYYEHQRSNAASMQQDLRRPTSAALATPTRERERGREWESPSPGGPPDTIVESMLSQSALLTPLKQRESHYTRLLAEHAAQGQIPEEEVKRYRHQYSIVQEITSMLENEPQDARDTAKLLHLMQLLQESGDPPPTPTSDPRLSLSPPPP